MALPPNRIAAAVLIGTKVRGHPDPDGLADTDQTIETHAFETARDRYWEPLFHAAGSQAITRSVGRMAMEQSIPDLIARLRAFQTRQNRENATAQSTAPIHAVTEAAPSG
ncbi:MAG: hypothetical protein AAFY65_12725 [Pseudomonadota bacterium]